MPAEGHGGVILGGHRPRKSSSPPRRRGGPAALASLGAFRSGALSDQIRLQGSSCFAPSLSACPPAPGR